MFISKKYYNYNLLVLVYFHELKMTIGKWKLFHSTYQILIIVLEKEKKNSITEKQKCSSRSKECINSHPSS